MSKLKGQQHHIDTQASVGVVTVSISGESIHTNREAQACAQLLAGVMSDLAYEGEFRVIASMQRVKGSSKLKGLSTQRVSINAVLLGYQPNGNDSRTTYTLQFQSADEAQKCFVLLKSYMGTGYNRDATIQSVGDIIIESPPVAEVAVLLVNKTAEVFAKPTEEPDVYYTKDPEWMFTTVFHLSEVADRHPDHQVTKDQVLDLIVERTHLKNRYGTAPIYRTLITRGHIVPIEGNEALFMFVETPPEGHKAKLPVKGDKKLKPQQAKAKEVRVGVKPRRTGNGGYLADAEWMQKFVADLRELVKGSNGIISRLKLHNFVMERSGQKKVAGVVQRIVAGLKTKLILIENGEEYYRVTYDPPANIVEQVIEGMEAARKETAKVFDGFAKFRLPDFAEGMFKNKKILDEFLFLVVGDGAKPAFLKEKLAELYPVSSWSHIQLLNYMIGQGYLIRSSAGKYANYTLGPKGLQRLGLPVKVLPIVATKAPTSVVEKSPEVAPPVPTPPQAPAVELSKPSQEPSVEAAPATAKFDPKVVQATAQVLAKAMADMGSADLVEARNVELRARRDALLLQKAQGPSPEAIDAAYLKALVEIADRL